MTSSDSRDSRSLSRRSTGSQAPAVPDRVSFVDAAAPIDTGPLNRGGPQPSASRESTTRPNARDERWLADFQDASERLRLAVGRWVRGLEREHPYFASESISLALLDSGQGGRIGAMSSASGASAVPPLRCCLPRCARPAERFSPFEGASARVCKQHFSKLLEFAAGGFFT